MERTIREHALAAAWTEWEKEHRPVLGGVLADAGLGKESVLEADGRLMPVEAIVRAIREEFLRVRVLALMQIAKKEAESEEEALRQCGHLGDGK